MRLYSIGINDLPSFFFSCQIAYAFHFGVLSLIRVKSPHHTGPSDIPHFPALIPDFTPRCLIGSKDPHHTSKPTHASTDRKSFGKHSSRHNWSSVCVYSTHCITHVMGGGGGGDGAIPLRRLEEPPGPPEKKHTEA